MRDPLDNEAVATVRSITGLEVHKAVSTEKRIIEANSQPIQDLDSLITEPLPPKFQVINMWSLKSRATVSHLQ